jgi:NADPH2:quinone reductase
MMVLFGQSSGVVGPIEPQLLAKGSFFVTRPGLGHYVATREELLWRAGDVLKGVASGKLDLRIDKTYPLEDAALAHRALESRGTSGKLLLIP